MRAFMVFCLAAMVGLGCAGLLPADPEGTARLRTAIEGAPAEGAFPLLLAGSAEASVVRFGCATAMKAASTADPEVRSTLLAIGLFDAMNLCPSTCVPSSAVDALAQLPREEKLAVALQHCDTAGPETLFVGPLAPLRASVPVLDYLAARMLVEVAMRADPEFDSVRDELAISLALGGLVGPGEVDGAEPGLSISPTREIELADLASRLDQVLEECEAPGEVPVGVRMIFDPAGALVGRALTPDNLCIARWTDVLEVEVGAAPDGAYTLIDAVWRP